MAESIADLSDILITPIARIVREIGESVGEAQKALDQASMQSQSNLQTSHPELAEIGYEVTWYQMPEVQVELKMAIHFEKKNTSSPPKLYLAPFNAKYKNALSYTADGSSALKLRIVPVPAPGAKPTT
jgi:hypothetical protein